MGVLRVVDAGLLAGLREVGGGGVDDELLDAVLWQDNRELGEVQLLGDIGLGDRRHA